MSKWIIITVALLAVSSAFIASANAAHDSFHTDVYVSGRNGYHTYRIPALIVTSEGTLLAFCEGRKTGRGDHGDIDLVLRRSTDGGKTWTPQQIVHEEGGTKKITIGNPCPVVDHSTGTIWLSFCRDNRDVFVTASKDDGVSWSEPRKITDSVKPDHWGWYATGPGVGIQLSIGEHKRRLVIPCDHREKIKGNWRMFSHVFYSDDHGKTWLTGRNVRIHTDECQVVQKADGSLLINMRNYWGRTGKVKEKGGMRATAHSTDGGDTWSHLDFDKTLVEPVCQASLIRFTSARINDKNRLLFSNPASSRKRIRMTVRLSYDEGETWPVKKVIYKGASAYSCLAPLQNDRIGLLFERDGYKKITFTSFTLDWLTDGADAIPK